MDESVASASSVIEWGVASATLAGETESGDLHIVREVGGGVLIGVVDGLGHGEEAATAAKVAVATLGKFAHEPIPSLVQRCHEALVGTRGVVMSLAFVDPGRETITWVGLGNVEGLLVHANWAERSSRTSLVTRAGVSVTKPEDLPRTACGPGSETTFPPANLPSSSPTSCCPGMARARMMHLSWWRDISDAGESDNGRNPRRLTLGHASPGGARARARARRRQ